MAPLDLRAVFLGLSFTTIACGADAPKPDTVDAPGRRRQRPPLRRRRARLAEPHDADAIASCYAPNPVPCGKAVCKDDLVCVGGEKGIHCAAVPEMPLSILGCTASTQCGEAGKCCTNGFNGSTCKFDCDVLNASVFCTTDADCKGLAEGMTFKCKPETDALVGLKSCQQ